jgi:NAD(P)-dependent dehydrogenase (short-subunit alcohol dehydrogenase family)
MPWRQASSAPTLTRRGRSAADVGEPQDVANAAVFLGHLSPAWITAQTLTVDGGRMDYIGHGQDRALTSGVTLDFV